MRTWRRILLLLLGAAVLLWWLLPGGGPRVEPGSTLVLELSGAYAEAADPPLLARLLGQPSRSLASLLSELRKAERDERIDAVLLRVRDLEIGWGKAHEIRAAIQGLGAAGRRTLAHLELPIGANVEYFVATAAQEVHASPASSGAPLGLAAEFVFLGGLWEKLGAGVEVEGVGEYKSAAETLSDTEMSPAHREMAAALLDSTNAEFVAGIAAGRGLSEAFVQRVIDEAPGSPGEMLALGLVDAVASYDESLDAVGAEPHVLASDYAAVDPAEVGFDPVARFALVYGSGPVVVGKGATSRTGAPVLASDTLVEAFEQVVADESIAAIVFRIDSPGGSPLAADLVWRASQLARKHDKPLVVSVSDVAASGGYYVAAAADAIYASPASLVGSIGVFVVRPVLGGLFEKLGIGVESMTRGATADLLLATRPLSDPARAHLRGEAEEIYRLFLERVAAGRPLDVDAVHEVGRGRVWTGAQALERGLVDGIGGLREAVAEAKRRAGLEPDADVALVPYPRPQTLAEQLDEALRRFGAVAGASAWSSPASPLPLPPLARRLGEWLAQVQVGTPSLLPPFWIDIR